MVEFKLRLGGSDESGEEGRATEEKNDEKQGPSKSTSTKAHIRGHSGNVDIVNVDEPQYFDHQGVTYMVERPVTTDEGERILVYDEGNPAPIIHAAGSSSQNVKDLGDEVYTASIVDQLANPSKSGELDILGKLSRIPPTFWIFILAVLVLWQSGTLGGLIPF